jgi:hypothetical protein
VRNIPLSINQRHRSRGRVMVVAGRTASDLCGHYTVRDNLKSLKAEQDADMAQVDADLATTDADAAVDFALSAVEEAEYGVLAATLSQMDADAAAKTSNT